MEWVEESLLEEAKKEEDQDDTRLLSFHNDSLALDSSEWFSRDSWSELVHEMCADQLASCCGHKLTLSLFSLSPLRFSPLVKQKS